MNSLFVLTSFFAASMAADTWKVKFDVEIEAGIEGSFVVEVHPEWAPLGAEQFKKIIDEKLYNDARFFRVVPNFVVQWGIPADPAVAAEWQQKRIQDDPQNPAISNKRGTITFAKSGPNTRTSQLFINFKDNGNLDSMGFPPFGEVISGMEIVDRINSEYGQQPNQGSIQSEGNNYLKPKFPRLSFIKSAAIIGESEL